MIDDKLHIPKYIQLKEDIKQIIESGKLQPDERMFSRNELIRDYSVSDITVRKAIDELTAEGYVYSIQGKGTFVARRKTKHLTIGLVISHLHELGDSNNGYLDQSYIAPLVHIIEHEVRKIGGRVLLCLDNDSVKEERKNLQDLMDREVDGIVTIYIGGEENQDCLIRIKEAGIPLVLMDRYARNIETSYVVTDSFIGAYNATKYLIQKNVASIHHLTCADEATTTSERLKGFAKALKDFELKGSIKRLTAVSSNIDMSEQSYTAAFDLLKLKHPIGVFAANSTLASSVWRCFRESGLEYDDFAISCFDKPPFAIPPDANIAWVQQPLEEMGKKCIQMLHSQMNGDLKSRKIILEPKIYMH